MTTATEIVQDVFARGKQEIPAWGAGMYQPNEDQFEAMAIEAVGIALQHTTPKLIVGLVLWNPFREYTIEYRSLEFSDSLLEQFHAQTRLSADEREYANARQFVIAVPGDLNDEQIVKYLDSRFPSIAAGNDVWTTALSLTQAV